MRGDFRFVVFLGLWVVVGTRASHAQVKQLFAFPCAYQANGTATCPLGSAPEAILQAVDGTVYGATNASGAATGGTIFPVNGGSIFSLAAGKLTLLHDFTASQGVYTAGSQPGAALLLGQDGSLYGTTFAGGTYNGGVLFRISTTGADFVILHNFCAAAQCADGQQPNGLIQGKNGDLYGTTYAGGIASSSCLGTGCGTVFRFTLPTKSFTLVHAFDPAQDGALPHGLIQASDGNFYGADCGASTGAGCSVGSAPGYLFRVTPGGQYTVLTTFPDLPLTGLAESTGGILFGIVLGSCGSDLFQVNLDGSGFQESGVCFTTWGAGTPIFASDGNLWLTSSGTGKFFNGAIYTLSPQGALLETYDSGGRSPVAPLIQLKNGEIAGSARSGGTPSKGTGGGEVYAIDAGLPAPGTR